MATEAQIRANRINAQKSTGPRTAEGKARSRRNSLKHGLAGSGVVLPIEDEALFLERFAGFSRSLLPADEMEHFLVGRVALASVRMDRCARKDLADSSRRRRKAIAKWESEQDRHVAFWSLRLATHPAVAVDNLEGFAAGCDWLIEQWSALAEALDTSNTWDEAQSARVLNLLGLADESEDDRALALRELVLETARPGPSADESIDTLRALADGESARLAALRAEVWEEQDGPSLAEAIASAGVVDDPFDALRHRYEREATREFHRSLNQLDRRRREADKDRRRGSRLATPRPERLEPDFSPSGESPTDPIEPDHPGATSESTTTWNKVNGTLSARLADDLDDLQSASKPDRIVVTRPESSPAMPSEDESAFDRADSRELQASGATLNPD